MTYNLPHQLSLRTEHAKEIALFQTAKSNMLQDGRHHHLCENCFRVMGTGTGKGQRGLGYPCEEANDHTQGCCLECHPIRGPHEMEHRLAITFPQRDRRHT